MIYSVDDMKSVFIGRVGESNARTVDIDVSSMLSEHPGASISLVMHRSDEDYARSCNAALGNDGILHWAVAAGEVYVAGDHPIEVRATGSGDLVLKSRTGMARVDGSISVDMSDDPPAAIETWKSTSDDVDYILGV